MNSRMRLPSVYLRFYTLFDLFSFLLYFFARNLFQINAFPFEKLCMALNYNFSTSSSPLVRVFSNKVGIISFPFPKHQLMSVAQLQEENDFLGWLSWVTCCKTLLVILLAVIFNITPFFAERIFSRKKIFNPLFNPDFEARSAIKSRGGFFRYFFTQSQLILLFLALCIFLDHDIELSFLHYNAISIYLKFIFYHFFLFFTMLLTIRSFIILIIFFFPSKNYNSSK